jgi:hypothetical protein
LECGSWKDASSSPPITRALAQRSQAPEPVPRKASWSSYGVLSFAVSRRSWEIGVRMALGAGRGRVLRDVMRDGSTPIVAGLALGLLGAAAGALRSQLFGIGASTRLAGWRSC